MQKVCIATLMTIAMALPAQAADYMRTIYMLTIKNHQFSPQALTLPVGEKIPLIVKNLDATAAEFESSDLNREKIVPPHGQITVYIEALPPGEYHFFDDFHRESTGTIIVK